jgi:hypothetical protein
MLMLMTYRLHLKILHLRMEILIHFMVIMSLQSGFISNNCRLGFSKMQLKDTTMDNSMGSIMALGKSKWSRDASRYGG